MIRLLHLNLTSVRLLRMLGRNAGRGWGKRKEATMALCVVRYVSDNKPHLSLTFTFSDILKLVSPLLLLSAATIVAGVVD
ncbi:hypothetical protein BDV26DRAFT_265689 [Aspergillus bertholletiae]|uniref:Uncharacterized protein n=1 Tax=Aspergillus bertholletiae TaxID=1226010 RepID=A0A5N7B2T8_9EURO|nr:hypothetical protein BDV26DRAFT_265689 [Aspergillus bertholletiae]